MKGLGRARALACVCLVLSTCGPDAGDREAGSSAVAAGSESAATASASPDDPAPGTFFVERQGGTVTVLASAAPLADVLRALADELGFDLTLFGADATAVSVELRRVALPTVLAAMLQGLAFETSYAFDPETSTHRLTRLQVGIPPWAAALREVQNEGPVPPPDVPSPPPASGGPAARGPAETPWEMERLVADAVVQFERQVEGQLQSADPSARTAALDELPAEGASLGQIVARLQGDSDARVRAAAARRLGSRTTYAATRALLGALRDPDAAVVSEALEALAASGDPTLAGEIRAALEGHSDAKLRGAAESAVARLTPSMELDGR